MTQLKARIYKPAKTAMQSGRGRTDSWLLEYEHSTARGNDPLMGWVSAGDTMNQPPLKFETLADAQDFAEENNIAYTISHSPERRIKPRNYGDNFKYRAADEG